MFLKKIKIHGFKSFANPIVIDFPAPLTAIVGPNGSGKSNVVDAIRWALGEQSARSLRGGKMSDIIFAGSADYKALEKASVTLYFDNSKQIFPSPEREIRIRRTVNREGQSDYYINGQACRLKDIRELLMDTGLGNESYSIVEQGKIDAILSCKPEKLRGLFEEAAGIVKHKTRKEEAEKRLEEISLDLQRVKDLIWELEKQLRPMKRSAEKLQKYRRFRDELEKLEVNLLLDQWEDNEKILLGGKKDEEALQERLTALEIRVEKTARFLSEKAEELRLEEAAVEELQNRLYLLRSKKEEAANQLQILLERDSGLRRERENHRKQLDNIQADLARSQKRKEELQGRIRELSRLEDDINETMKALEDELSAIKRLITTKKEELHQRRDFILSENLELKEMQSELEQRREKGRYLEREIERLAAKRKLISEEFDENLLKRKELQERRNILEAKFLSSKQELLACQKREAELTAEIKKEEEKIEAIKNQYNHSSSHLKLLQEMEDEYEGYYRGVRMVLQHREQLPGIRGVIADLIQVDKKYELAIETALGGRLQNIVTEDDAAARRAVKFLKENKGGKATFLPLNMVRGNRARVEKAELDKLPGFIGLASDLVAYSGEMEGIIHSLLGRTLVSEDLDTAVEIAKKIKGSLQIVTLDGDYISSGGAITGGSQTSTKPGLLGRSREINELKEKLRGLAEVFEEEKARLEALKQAREELLSSAREKEEELKRLEFENNDLSKDMLNLDKESSRLEKELELIDKDFEEYHSQLGMNDNILQRLEKELSIINNEQFREREEIGQKEEEIWLLEEKEEEKNRELTEIRIELATIQQEKDSLQRELDGLESDYANLKDREQDLQKILQDIEDKLIDIAGRQAELEEMERDFFRESRDVEEEYNKQAAALEEKEEQLKRLQENYNRDQLDLNKIREEYHRISFKISRLEDKRIQIQERLLEEYEVDPEKGYPDRFRIENQAMVSQRVQELKDSIKRLGPINLAAVEEYEELKERLDYLKEQKDDLIQAKDSVEKVIEELERSMSSLFYQTFVAVKEEFEKTFQELFNGGKAELYLTKPENLMETGIDIEAQPPGKQLKNLTLMSGGERALTAIALVFAFLRVNPSPLYILDEIDAPLDDANVRRFINYLKAHSRDAQFLIITHNKIMMSEADIIYGVTMEEKGVSKVVSLRLDEEIA